MAGAEISKVTSRWYQGALLFEDTLGNIIFALYPSTGAIGSGTGLALKGRVATAAQTDTTIALSTGPTFTSSTNAVTFTLPQASTMPGAFFKVVNQIPDGDGYIRIITNTTNYFQGYGMALGSTGNSVLRNTSTSNLKGDYVGLLATVSQSLFWTITDMVGTWTMGAAT